MYMSNDRRTDKKRCGSFVYVYLYLLEKTMATHSSTLAWRIPRKEEPGRLQSMGSLRVGHNWATSLPLSLSCIGEGNGNPLQCSSLENPRDRGAWWAAVCGVAQSRTRLKWLSRSSSSMYIYHNGTLLSHRKNEIISFSTIWMDLEIIVLSEVCQRKTYILWKHLCVESKNMIEINLCMNEKQIHKQRRFMLTKKKRVWGDKLGVLD